MISSIAVDYAILAQIDSPLFRYYLLATQLPSVESPVDQGELASISPPYKVIGHHSRRPKGPFCCGKE